MSDICDCCHKRKPIVKDPEVLGVRGFKPNVFICVDCLEWAKQNIQQKTKEGG